MMSEQHIVFTYGTLMSERVLRAVLGRVPKRVAAQLYGYERHPICDQCYPVVVRVQDQNKVVNGKILLDISTKELTILDSFEDPTYERRLENIRCLNESKIQARVWARSNYETADLVLNEDWNFEHFVSQNENEYVQRCTSWANEYYVKTKDQTSKEN